MDEKFFLYDFGFNGLHDGKVLIGADELPEVMRTVVEKARIEKRDVTITDMEDFCIFEMKAGEVVHPTPEMIEAAKAADPPS